MITTPGRSAFEYQTRATELYALVGKTEDRSPRAAVLNDKLFELWGS